MTCDAPGLAREVNAEAVMEEEQIDIEMTKAVEKGSPDEVSQNEGLSRHVSSGGSVSYRQHASQVPMGRPSDLVEQLRDIEKRYGVAA